jgi:hypothetical protein
LVAQAQESGLGSWLADTHIWSEFLRGGSGNIYHCYYGAHELTSPDYYRLDPWIPLGIFLVVYLAVKRNRSTQAEQPGEQIEQPVKGNHSVSPVAGVLWWLGAAAIACWFAVVPGGDFFLEQIEWTVVLLNAALLSIDLFTLAPWLTLAALPPTRRFARSFPLNKGRLTAWILLFGYFFLVRFFPPVGWIVVPPCVTMARFHPLTRRSITFILEQFTHRGIQVLGCGRQTNLHRRALGE